MLTASVVLMTSLQRRWCSFILAGDGERLNGQNNERVRHLDVTPHSDSVGGMEH